MPDDKYDVTFDGMEQITIIENNRPVEAWRIFFTIGSVGQFYVDVKTAGYSPEIGRTAVQRRVKEIIETLI